MRVLQQTEDRLELSMHQISDRIGNMIAAVIFGVIPPSLLLSALMETQRTGNMKNVPALLLGIIVLGGIGCGLGWKSVRRDFRATCTFDRTTGEMVLQRSSVWQRQTIQHPLHLVRGVEVKECTRNVVSKGHKTYGIYLILQSGERQLISLADMTSSKHYNEVAKTIRRFLNQPSH